MATFNCGVFIDFHKKTLYNESVAYTYGNGIRTIKVTTDDVNHFYTLDGTKILKEEWNGNVLVPLYDNEDSVCGIIYNGKPYYFIKNFQEDVICIVDSKEKTVATYNYDAWGKIISIEAEDVTVANANPFRYRSYYYDRETNIYYLQSRYYDPDTGRFLNADSPEYLFNAYSSVSSNLFTYCYNTPVNAIDQFGFCGTTFRPIDRVSTSTSTNINKTKKDYSSDNWIAKILGAKSKLSFGFDVLGASFKLTLSSTYGSYHEINKDSFTANFESGSLTLGWGGKLEFGVGLSFGRYSIGYLRGIDWTKSYLAVIIGCTSKDGKAAFECELYFSLSHLLKLAIAVLVVGACVVVPTLAPACTSFVSIVTTAAKSIYPYLTALIPMFEKAATMSLQAAGA